MFLCRSFPWSGLENLPNLASFSLTNSGLTEVAANINWPERLTFIDLSANPDLTELPAHFLSRSSAIDRLSLRNMSSNFHLGNNVFHLTAKTRPTLDLSLADNVGVSMVDENAFGNVDGGELWGRLNIALQDFPEGAFRLMIKSHFDEVSPGIA